MSRTVHHLARGLLTGTLLPVLVLAAGGPRDLSGAYTATGKGGQAATPAAALNNAGDNCKPDFVPGVAAESTAHIVMGREVMVIVHETNHVTRRIYLDARHPPSLQPSTYGHSIGWWEGDTLVVETVGLPTGLTVVERMRKVNDGHNLEVIVDGHAARAELHPELRYMERLCEPSSAATAAKAEGRGTAAASAGDAHHPDFEGVWRISRPVRMLRTAEGRAPPLRPEARKLYEHRIELFKEGKAAEFNGSEECLPPGEPRTPHGGQLFDIVQGDDAIFFGYTWNRMLRIAYFADNVPVQLPASYHGSWAAHWDGDALILEGGSFRADSLLDASGLPHSDALHLTQRLSLKRGGHDLAIRTTIEDPKAYTRSWSTVQHYTRRKGAVVEENICVPRSNKE